MSAVFLDRDGVINELVWHDDRQEYGAPRSIEEIKLIPSTIQLINTLHPSYLIFIITNQPDAAKGIISYDRCIELNTWFKLNIPHITEYYACLHHPSRCKCLCRKPGTLFVEQAMNKYHIDPYTSYFIGDRDTDIECGLSMNLNTMLFKYNKHG